MKLNNLKHLHHIALTYLDLIKSVKLDVTVSSYTKRFPHKLELLHDMKGMLPSNLQHLLDTQQQIDIIDKALSSDGDTSKMLDEHVYFGRVSSNLLARYPNISQYRLELGQFLSINIHQYIEKLMKTTYLVKFQDTITGIEGSLEINAPTDIYSTEKIRKIVARILMFNRLLNINRVPRFKVYACKYNKMLPEQNMPFSPDNVNTAATDGTTIIIWRDEELLKSIFHEGVHFHDLECRAAGNMLDVSNYSVHNTNNEFLFFEATTEFLANILNQVVNCACEDFEDFRAAMLRSMRLELAFALNQQCKILAHVGCRSWRDFCGPGLFTKRLVESTNVLSYYILKTQILWNIDDVLDILELPNLKMNYDKVSRITRILENMKTNRKYIRYINTRLKRLMTRRTIIRRQSARMTRKVDD